MAGLYHSGLSAGARSIQSCSRLIVHERSAQLPLTSAPSPWIVTVGVLGIIVIPAGIGKEWPDIDPESSSIMKTLAGGSVEVNGGI